MVYDSVHPTQGGLVVLLYHRVGGGSGLELDLSATRFEKQMAELARTHRVVTLEHGLELLRNPLDPVDAAADSRQPVAVTFDDGYVDFTEQALPILVQHQIPATVYAATAFIDQGLEFYRGGPPASWSSLAEAHSTGLVDIGSHTHTHSLLDRLPPDQIADELDRSITLIEDRLGISPRDFAYPKALMGSPEADAAVRARFRSAAVAGTKPNVFGETDAYALHRSPVQRTDGMRWFRRKADGGMGLEDSLRKLANRARYARAST